MTGDWRYLAQHFTGDGSPGDFIETELPLRNVVLTDVLSGPPQLTGSLDPAYNRLLVPTMEKRPLLDYGATAIYAECDSVIRGGGLLQPSAIDGPKMSIDCSGFCGYPKGKPWLGTDFSSEGIEVLDVVRMIWNHLQTWPGGDLGIVLSSLTTGVTVGHPASTDSTADGPYELNWWTTADLGDEIDKLAKSTPFAYHESHSWNVSGTNIEHFLDFGYPSLGVMRPELRFVHGENVSVTPQVSGRDPINEVFVLGAGEGRDMVRGHAAIYDGRIRNVLRIVDQTIQSNTDADNRARYELARRQGLVDVKSIVVRESPMAQLGTWSVGDTIRIQADLDWINVDQWAMIIGSSITPEDPNIAVLNLSLPLGG